jgi:hypothetical protein
MGERGGVYTGLWWGNLRARDHLEDPGIDGKVILRWIFRKWYGSVDCIDLAQEMDRWQAFVNVIMNIRVSQIWEIS